MRLRRLGPSLVIDTPAKLNLHLDVLGRRPDGFHELETVMVSVGLYDTLAFSIASEEVELAIVETGRPSAHPLPTDDRNIIVRAAQLLRDSTGCRLGARIRLYKRIPAEAGLGGGSSDAAATLVGLNRLWDLQLELKELHSLAARLGSDLNFFLESAPLAICRGRGELVEPRPLRGPLWFVVTKPHTGLSTAAVFRELQPSEIGARDISPLLTAAETGHAARIGRTLWNALEGPSRRLSLELNQVLRGLAAQNLPGLAMSGSGSACFGVCASRQQASCVATRLRRTHPVTVHVVSSAT